MIKLTAIRKSHLAANSLLLLIGLTFMITWLPLLRSAFDGQSYQWGTNFFGYLLGGKGITSHYLFLVMQLCMYMALFLSFYWSQKRWLNYVLMGLWWVLIFGNIFFQIFTEGDPMFHGDTLNVHVPLSTIIIPLSLMALALILVVIRWDLRADEESVPWSQRNRILLWILLGLLPIQLILLSGGEPHGITDQIGVLISIAQCFLIPFIVRPYKSSE